MSMKLFTSLLLITLTSMLFTSCTAIADIFKAGMGFGIFIVIAVIVLVVVLIMRAGGKKNP